MKEIRKYKSLISTSNSFHVEDKLLIIANDEGLFLIIDDLKVSITDTIVYSFKPFKNMIFYQIVNGGKLILYRNHHENIIDGNFYLCSALYLNSTFFIRAKIDNLKFINSFNELSLTFETTSFPFLPDKLLQNCYFAYSANNIFKYDFFFKTLWQKEFVTDITKLEVWNETVVLVELSTQFIHQIIALDATTGTTLWEKEGARMQLLTNELYFLEHTQTRFFIKKFDLGKNELFEYNIIENVKAQFGNALPSFSYTIKEHLAYLSFTSEKVVMIINLNTLNTEWSHQLETEAWQIYEPRVEGVRLYVLDSDKTLHIFENE